MKKIKQILSYLLGYTLVAGTAVTIFIAFMER